MEGTGADPTVVKTCTALVALLGAGLEARLRWERRRADRRAAQRAQDDVDDRSKE